MEQKVLPDGSGGLTPASSLDGLADRLVEALGLPGTDQEVQEIALMVQAALDLALQTDRGVLLEDALRSAHDRLEVRGLVTGDCQGLGRALESAGASVLSAAERERLHVLLARVEADPSVPDPRCEDALAPVTRAYVKHLLRGDRKAAIALTRQCVTDGMDMFEILVDVLEPAQREVGRLWALGLVSIAQEHFCTAVTTFAMTDLYPVFFTGVESRRRLLAVHVPGSAHHLGLRMVTDVLECRDWSTTYFVEDVSVDTLADLVVEEQAELVLISASMPGDVTEVKRMISALRQDPRTRGVRVVVGGRPFSVDPDLVEAVGADGWARDARSAVDLCDKLVGVDVDRRR